ncbi:hypothetical protein [uncultured Roseovarius sp.]|uniref:hypothetical protein n=1 Tax=uncultured Roseovarius sp. TaxID=293344 RepID=UPI002611B148|nr:hypothetical protein [uncultured Roseovarius sp.]
MIFRRLISLFATSAFLTSTAFGQTPDTSSGSLPFASGLSGEPTFNLTIGDPVDDPKIDIAVECLADTRVLRFQAAPTTVQPFAATTLSWQVQSPPGCPVALNVAGQKVPSTGTLNVTPVHVTNRFGLSASMLGVRGTLATTEVNVDQATCRDQDIPQNLVTPQIIAAIDEFDADEGDIEQIEPAQVQIQSNGLFIHMVMKAKTSPVSSARVTLDIGLRFIVRDGIINPRYTLFRPNADTILPDDFVESKFFDRADGILADFRSGFNESIGVIVGNNQKLFDLVTEQFNLRATICEVEAPPAPRLTVQLRVLPAGDPGRFNLRVDGVTRAGNQGNGGSTPVLNVTEGTHAVSQTAAGQTKLSDYKTFIGGNCNTAGAVSLQPGDFKICRITNIRQQNPDQCQADCRREQQVCNSDPSTTPQICAQLFKICTATCN